MEELLESDVLWPEEEEVNRPMTAKRFNESDGRKGLRWRLERRSAPVSIPEKEARRPFDDGMSKSEADEIVPPHVLVSRRWNSAAAAFTLSSRKGRQLSHVRDTVLRMTGFLEN